jgi:hypothetical protein
MAVTTFSGEEVSPPQPDRLNTKNENATRTPKVSKRFFMNLSCGEFK